MAIPKQARKNKKLDAVYEHGVFRLLDADEVSLPEGQRVHLIIEPVETPRSSLELLIHLYDGLPEEDIDEIEEIILDRKNYFAGRPST
ncbi:MAG TPA: antitoxin family protein [Chloroflexia bacterium]|nr:antitoxin family protein [Chloroflexia bacterium]